MVSIARESLNIGDGKGSTIDPLCWDKGSRPKVRRVDERVLVELAQLPGPPGFLDYDWVTIDSGSLTNDDISLWPFSVSLLVMFVTYLSTLRWPKGLNEMGRFSVSYLEMLVLFEQWVGHRLLPEKTVPIKNRSGRNIVLGSSPISEGVKIRAGCQFIGSLFRSFAPLPGGFCRFIPGRLGPHLSRLRHFGWLQCGHGLTCRPVESSMPRCIGSVLDLLGYPVGSVSRLAIGTLNVRFCNTPFASRLPSWVLGSDVDAHQVITSRLKNMEFPPSTFSSPDIDSGGIVHPLGNLEAGDLPLSGGVEDTPRVIRRSLSRKTPPHELGIREASPPPKRRKWLSLPGPFMGNQESSYFPRVGVG